MKSKLRVGILLDDYWVPAWMLQMIRNIINSAFAEVVLVVLNDREVPQKQSGQLATWLSKWRSIGSLSVRKALELVYAKLIERKTYLPDANRMENCEHVFASTPTLKVKALKKGCAELFSQAAIDKIAEKNIDILVRCGFGRLREEVLGVARYGIWSFHHGDILKKRGGPAGFWESMESWPETGSVLQILSEDHDNGKVLCRSYSCTNTMSLKDNRSKYIWKSLSFMTRKMKDLYDVGEKEFFEKVDWENRHPVFYSQRLYTKPSNLELLRLTLRKVLEKARLLLENIFYFRQWILMFHLKDGFSSSLWRYKKLLPPKDRFWADPHVIYRDHKYFIFMEEFLYETEKGHIAVLLMDENGSYTEPTVVLERPYHLSYPFVFEHQDDLYMIPESAANKTIELYKCVEFPHKWVFQRNLMENIRSADTTLIYHQNTWWMFATVVENGCKASLCDELFLFYSDELFSSEWTPHPQNPVVSDCKSARPAGKIFINNGSLYRPSQNCAHHYGYGFNLSEITCLDKHSYSEVVVSRVEPNWDKRIVGTHTFNRANSLHVIDAIYKRPKYW